MNVRKEQRQSLYQHLLSLDNNEKVICVEDFNATSRFLWKEDKLENTGFEICCPSYDTKEDSYKRTNKQLDSWGYVHKKQNGLDKGKGNIDHFIIRGVTINQLKYDWDFVSKENGYKDDNNRVLKSSDYKSFLIGYPDHEILIAEIDIKD